MRVLHLTRDFPPRINGGISTAVGGMVRALTEHGVPCRVASFDAWRPRAGKGDDEPPRREQLHGAEVLRLSSPSQLEALGVFAGEWACDVVHVHHAMLWEALERLPSSSRGNVLGIHVVQQALHALRGGGEPTMSLTAQCRAMDQADAVLVPSRAAERVVRREQPGIADRLVVMPLALHDSDVARAAVAARAKDAALAPGAAAPLSLLYVGRFGDVKGTRELFELIPRVLARLPDARFVVAGGLPDNRKADARWRRRAAEHLATVVDRVELTGWLSPSELAARYAAADLLISPSWHESFGLAPLEAMLHGTALLATRSGGPEELIEDGVSGVLVAPRDVQALLDAAVALAMDRPRLQALGMAAAERARSSFLWPARVGELVRVYESLPRRA